MRKYTNETLGFELLLPDSWPNPIETTSDTIIFDRAPIERINIIVGPLNPERLIEFTQLAFCRYAQTKGYTDVELGKIAIENINHACAKYNMGNNNWTKKYMVVFGYTEYAITASCYDKNSFLENEKQWDLIVKTFRLLEWRKNAIAEIINWRTKLGGELYEKAYEEAAEGRYIEACNLLEKCLEENPNNILAQKEIAFILKTIGDYNAALRHRLIVKHLDPTDQINQYNLSIVYFILGIKEEAIHEIDDLIIKSPKNQRYLQTKQYYLHE
jgi:tetratricopeptide (TPR) repeat protein